LRRASARSRPNLRSAWAAGNGMEPVFDIDLVSRIADVKSSSVLFIGRYCVYRSSTISVA
jgi:hypothetical protein